MAQLVARLVRNEKVGGSNPPSSTTGRHPIRMSVFCMPGRWSGAGLLCCSWRRWCSGRRRARPPARSPHASLRLGVVDLEARPCPPDPPAPSTPAAQPEFTIELVACGAAGVPGAARAVPWAGLLDVPVGGGPPARRPRRELRSARRLEARPGPATAHGHRSQALLRPPVPRLAPPASSVLATCGV